MLLRILLLLLLVPLVDLFLLFKIGSQIGFLPTLGLLIAAGMIGTALVRRAGVRAITQIQADLAAGRLPGDSLLDGLIVLVAAVLFVLPGVLTDVAGLVLLILQVRRLVREFLKSRLKPRMIVLHHPGQSDTGNSWVDVRPTDARDVSASDNLLPRPPDSPPAK